MTTVFVPSDAEAVACPQCGLMIHNLAHLGVRRQVGCQCGVTVMVDRRRASTVPIAVERRQASPSTQPLIDPTAADSSEG